MWQARSQQHLENVQQEPTSACLRSSLSALHNDPFKRGVNQRGVACGDFFNSA